MIDSSTIRARFPSLRRPAIFFDNPGGTQVAQPVIDRMSAYMVESNANHGGAFTTSRASDTLVDEARSALADFLNATCPEEIVFGLNMTTLTFHISRSIARILNPGDDIIVTRLDHDANITPWTIVAEERGCHVRWIDFHPENGTLDQESLKSALGGRPRLVAVGYASNSLGTINPVKQIVDMAHSVGALVYVDAVHYAPHGMIDVQQIGCDFLVCSAYKFFGPHIGVLYGRYDLLDGLFPYRVRPAPGSPPGKFETGTGNFEGMAGALGAIEYLEWFGETFGGQYAEKYADRYTGRRLKLKQAMTAIHAYEIELSQALLGTLEETPGVTIYGIKEMGYLEQRVPTYSFTLQGMHSRRVAELLGEKNIFVWDGNYYALAVTERLGLEGSGGMVRVGPVHYNTLEEIDRFRESLGRITQTI